MNITHHRPYWHVDLKWMFGILAFAALWAALFLQTLAHVTERGTATTITSSFVANLVSKEGMGDDQSINELRQKLPLIPGDTITPFEQFPWITISKADIAAKSPEEIRLAIVKQLTDPIYDKGLAEASKEFTTDINQQKNFQQQASILGVLNQNTHESIDTLSKVALGVSLFAMIGVVFFSAGWGRLVSPGVILLLVTPVGLALSLLLLNIPAGGDNFLSTVPASVTQKVGGAMNSTYLLPATTGAALLIIAAIGKIVTAQMHRKAKATT